MIIMIIIEDCFKEMNKCGLASFGAENKKKIYIFFTPVCFLGGLFALKGQQGLKKPLKKSYSKLVIFHKSQKNLSIFIVKNRKHKV